MNYGKYLALLKKNLKKLQIKAVFFLNLILLLGFTCFLHGLTNFIYTSVWDTSIGDIGDIETELWVL